MHDRDYILDLLSRGAAAADVARIVNCSASYISQLLNEEAFARDLASKRSVHLSERNSRAQKVQAIHDQYLTIEETLLRNLGQQAKANLLKPIEQMKLLQVVAGKKEPAQAMQENISPGQITNITNISLPAMVAAKFVLNENKEIIGTESGTSFAPMSGVALKSFAEERTPERKAIPQISKTEDIMNLFIPKNPDELKIAF